MTGGPHLPTDTDRVTPRVAVRAVLVALLLGALLNGPGLVAAATNLQLGPARQVATAVGAGVASGAAAVGLDRPRRGLEHLRDLASGSGASPGTTGTPGGDAAPSPGRTASDGEVRVATAEDPVEVLLIGDSLIGAVAAGYGRLASERDEIAWSEDVRVGTGLARPDVLDWHVHLDQQLAVHDPDVVVLMLGGNDHQSLVDPGGDPIHLGADGWEEEYEARVGRLLDVAGAGGRTVVWLELPAMRPADLEEVRPRLNAAVRRAAEARRVSVVDTGAVVSPEGYNSRADGEQLRAEDGVHLTHPGGDRVAAVLAELIDQRWPPAERVPPPAR